MSTVPHAERAAGALAPRAEAAQHFRPDRSAMSYAELWKAGRLSFPICVVQKLLRLPGPLAVLAPLSTALGQLRWPSLPERGRGRLRVIVGELGGQGFCEVLLYTEDWRAFALDCFSVALLDRERTTLVLATYTCFYGQGPLEGMPLAEHVDLVFHSFMDDGRVVLTRSSKYLLLQPPEYEAVHLGEAPPREVAAAHARRLKEATASASVDRASGPWSVLEEDELPERILALSRRETQFQTERGVYVPATAEELATLEGSRPATTTAKPGRILLVWGVVIVLGLVLANLW